MTLDELKNIREKMQSRVDTTPGLIDHKRVVVGMATCGIASGAAPVLEQLQKSVSELGISDVEVRRTGCVGLCQYEPIVEVYEPGKDKVTYIKMTPEKAAEVVEQHLKNGSVCADYTVSSKQI